MITTMVKKVIAQLPVSGRDGLRRVHFRRQIRTSKFIPYDEPEIHFISETVKSGDWVIDVGANVGHYALHLSKCAGEAGRVVAFEPVPATFAVLSSNISAARANNVTLLNLAVSSSSMLANIEIPKSEESGLENLYRAKISQSTAARTSVLCVTIDSMPMLSGVRLIKIDAEGHDLQVLKGAELLIDKDRPHLIVEATDDGEIAGWIRARGYVINRAGDSPNITASPA